MKFNSVYPESYDKIVSLIEMPFHHYLVIVRLLKKSTSEERKRALERYH